MTPRPTGSPPTPTRVLDLSFAVLSILFFCFLFQYNWSTATDCSYRRTTLQARAFLEGRLYLFDETSKGITLDTVLYKGRYYWPLSPVPALLLMPIICVADAARWAGFRQDWIQFLLSMVMYCLAVRIAHRVGYSFRDALALAFAFCFASNVLPVIFAGGDCPLAHVMTLLLSLWALDESMRRNRQWLIGICLAGVFAIRPTAGLIAAFFILDVIFGSIIPLQKKVSRCALLILPICVAGILLAFYNQLRFDDFFDTGYKTAFIGPPFYGLVRERYGLFSLRSILTNFYWYFLAGPRPVTEPGTYHLVFPYVFPNSIGMSFFILSPIFLRLFWARIIGKRQIFLWITSLVILVVLLTYYSTGFVQIGPRYMLDLLPLWYILLLYSFDGMRLRMRHYVFILASFAGDLFLTIFQ